MVGADLAVHVNTELNILDNRNKLSDHRIADDVHHLDELPRILRIPVGPDRLAAASVTNQGRELPFIDACVK